MFQVFFNFQDCDFKKDQKFFTRKTEKMKVKGKKASVGRINGSCIDKRTGSLDERSQDNEAMRREKRK